MNHKCMNQTCPLKGDCTLYSKQGYTYTWTIKDGQPYCEKRISKAMDMPDFLKDLINAGGHNDKF